MIDNESGSGKCAVIFGHYFFPRSFFLTRRKKSRVGTKIVGRVGLPETHIFLFGLVGTYISSDSNSLYRKVLDIATAINDVAIIDRLASVPNGDLVAIEARYHRKKVV